MNEPIAKLSIYDTEAHITVNIIYLIYSSKNFQGHLCRCFAAQLKSVSSNTAINFVPKLFAKLYQ